MGAHQGRPAGDHVLAGSWSEPVAFAIFYLVFEGVPKFEPLQWRTWAACCSRRARHRHRYFIWFNIIGRLSTAMASLGSLINPGSVVIGAVIILGDRRPCPT